MASQSRERNTEPSTSYRRQRGQLHWTGPPHCPRDQALGDLEIEGQRWTCLEAQGGLCEWVCVCTCMCVCVWNGSCIYMYMDIKMDQWCPCNMYFRIRVKQGNNPNTYLSIKYKFCWTKILAQPRYPCIIANKLSVIGKDRHMFYICTYNH